MVALEALTVGLDDLKGLFQPQLCYDNKSTALQKLAFSIPMFFTCILPFIFVFNQAHEVFKLHSATK